ncbi:MAG: 4'-phosphopantetheinyl transferase superfamily protein [Oscillospiraceae bacterium]|nr:4'-phosphopantetheinyl transferase superfamily protein [Oscillospiraceae bacterium]
MILISTKQVPISEQHTHAHSLLSRALKEFGINYVPDETQVIRGEHGKPSLSEHPEVRYNISHADGIAAVVVSEFECGIDCERIRAYRPSVLKRCFCEEERSAVEAAPECEQNLMFFRLWTLKEAYVKALGRGLSFPLREAAFAFEGDDILTELSEWAFKQYIIGNEFIVSVCKIRNELSIKHESNMIYHLHAAEDISVYFR